MLALEAPYDEVALRDILEMIHKEDVDGSTTNGAQERHAAGRDLLADNSTEPRGYLRDESHDRWSCRIC